MGPVLSLFLFLPCGKAEKLCVEFIKFKNAKCREVSKL